MTGAGVFLPIFDPILDSFETLRTREPFCFAVILTLASCIGRSGHREQCLSEVKELLARSLFHYPASLGKVQGMLLLIVYAENSWFAIGHALQMAVDLGLDKALSRDQMPDHESPSSNTAGQREEIRRAKVWLALCFIEREIAIGTARSSRIPKVAAADLSRFTRQAQAHPPNMRIASLVEAVQIRGLASGRPIQSTTIEVLLTDWQTNSFPGWPRQRISRITAYTDCEPCNPGSKNGSKAGTRSIKVSDVPGRLFQPRQRTPPACSRHRQAADERQIVVTTCPRSRGPASTARKTTQ